MARETFYTMTLVGNVSPWDDMNVIVESTSDLCGHEHQLEEVKGYVEEIKNALVTRNFFYDIERTISTTEASFEQLLILVILL